ncbi:MAG: hypothetical protein IKH92_06420 [Clostridiales bacterium]|nr:hypothetical protein [Clostridiales bacterium]
MYRKLLAFLTAVLFVAASIPVIGKASVRAASSRPLTDATSQMQDGLKASITCGGIELTNNSTVHYGDTLVCTLEWKIPNNDIFPLAPGDSLTYELPSNVDFDAKTGKIMNGTKELGDYVIQGHTITLTYTDPDFCAQKDRVGKLSFYGSIENDPNPATSPDPIVISFTGARDITLLVEDNPINASLKVDKVFHVVDNPNHIYECIIEITATGNQTNVLIEDTMWPGMELTDTPDLYTDAGHQTKFSDHSGFTYNADPNIRTFRGTINKLTNGQTVYLYYHVKVNDDMYDKDKGQQFVESNGYTTPGNFYEDGYSGTIPNRVKVSSTQVPEPVVRTTDIYGAGYNMVKWRAASVVDKNTGIDELELGYIRWQLFLNPIGKDSIAEGEIVDILPENSSFDDSSLFFHDSRWNEIDPSSYFTYRVTTENGKKVLRIKFESKLIAELKNRTEGLYIEYRTHIDKQTSEKFEYINTATLTYKGEDPETRVARYENKKPSELNKMVSYDAALAPYAYYAIVVNPMGLDLDPNSDEVILKDNMASTLDLDPNSITIDGVPLPSSEVNFDPQAHTFSIKLKDSTRYVVKYRARVNLVPSDDPGALNRNNSLNTCELVGVVTYGNDAYNYIRSKVHDSAASSSSNIGYATYNIFKHDESSTTKFLSGATFDASSVTLDGQTVKSTTSIGSKTTGTDGKVTFDSLVRGKCYLFFETKAPDGYELDDTPNFVIFAETSSSTYPSTVTYNNKSYPVQVVDFSHYSFDAYISNSPETTPTTSATTPSSSATTPTSQSDPTTASTSAAPSETTLAPSETTPETPSESTGDVANALRNTQTDESTTTTTAAKTTGGIVKTGEAISMLAFFGIGMIAVSFLTVIFLQKKDRKNEE